MSDGKYFASTKKGEILEFKAELHSSDKSKRKDAVKKVIAAMTVGKDVSMLFPDVVNCMQTDDLELKKLVYLYLINYAKTQPDLAIMGVNTFVKDSQDPNPLIRALAVRTMGCIRVDKITEYLCDPLHRTLKDDDPYVRKTAAMCVAKLHDINSELVEDQGFLDTLKDLLADSNPMVVANAVAALSEIQDSHGREVFQINTQYLFKILRALNECTEWGQVFILDSLARYQAENTKDAESVIERVLPRLQHANCAVVLSAVKVIIRQLGRIDDDAQKKSLLRKMAPPLVTLLSTESELQYVVLRNISIIVHNYPQMLDLEVKVFFCKYNDPIYVKMEKLDVMTLLVNERNVDQVLLEFKEYATEVDADFVRKAVRAIGQCAVSLESAAERCINVLLELIRNKVNYVVQESIIVIKDIFRRYPNKYESVIATLCEHLDTLDEPEAKASMVWIIGEYAERIDNADELLEFFLETFPEEAAVVQMQLVTAAVKLFLKKPTERPQQMIQQVLTYATQETDNPDLRDRAYIYWRLLSTDPEAAKEVVLAEKPVISNSAYTIEPPLVEVLLKNIATIASVYHRPPESFVSYTRLAVQRAEDMTAPVLEDGTTVQQTAVSPENPAGTEVSGKPTSTPELSADLLSLDDPSPTIPQAPTPAPTPAQPLPQQAVQPLDLLQDLNDGLMGNGQASQQELPLSQVYSGKGVSISGRLVNQSGEYAYRMAFQNSSGTGLDGFMIQFNNNALGLIPASQHIQVQLPPGGNSQTSVPLNRSQNMVQPAAGRTLQIAIRCNQLGVIYFNDTIPDGV